MKRYQIYLNPQSVKTIDEFQREVKLSRSRIISLTVDALARNLLFALPPRQGERGTLDDLIGLVRLPRKQRTNIAQTVDRIYSSD